MRIRLNTNKSQNESGTFDLAALLHPGAAFAHPRDVTEDPDLTLNEKRAILASWASDACAVESAPALRAAPAGSQPVTFDDVMDALRSLDEQARTFGKPEPHYKKVLAQRHSGPRRADVITTKASQKSSREQGREEQDRGNRDR